jgi:hypothetical protein
MKIILNKKGVTPETPFFFIFCYTIPSFFLKLFPDSSFQNGKNKKENITFDNSLVLPFVQQGDRTDK